MVEVLPPPKEEPKFFDAYKELRALYALPKPEEEGVKKAPDLRKERAMQQHLLTQVILSQPFAERLPEFMDRWLYLTQSEERPPTIEAFPPELLPHHLAQREELGRPEELRGKGSATLYAEVFELIAAAAMRLRYPDRKSVGTLSYEKLMEEGFNRLFSDLLMVSEPDDAKVLLALKNQIIDFGLRRKGK